MEKQQIIAVPYDDLSPQSKAQHELSIIKRFLMNGFDGEHMYKLDQEIINAFTSLKDEAEKKKKIEDLEKVAYTFN